MKKITLLMVWVACSCLTLQAQPGKGIRWSRDGQSVLKAVPEGITAYPLSGKQAEVKIPAARYTPDGATRPLKIKDFYFSADEKKVLLYTNTRKVWRYETRGDYWVLDVASGKLKQLGKGKPEASLMFAKLSPDGRKAAYVSEHNIYVEDLETGAIKALTTDGTRRFINGTFDWAYEEEFGCRDGFRWSPDGNSIAYWQIDATKIRDFLMINNTDSIYSFNVPVEYPVAGERPSACRVGVADIQSAKTTWLQVPGDQQQHYIPRMEWIPGKNELIIQQLNRKQNHSKVMICDAANGKARTLYEESDSAWIDVKSRWDDDNIAGWDFIRNGKSFIWVSEQDGWRHLYNITLDGKATLLTPGNYDVISIAKIDEANNVIYFLASPQNPTQQYLYRVPLSGGKAERITPADEAGTHDYKISPYGAWAVHEFSNAATYPVSENLQLPAHVSSTGEVKAALKKSAANKDRVEYFEVTTEDGISLNGWMRKPANFDPAKKYPIVFYVYGEPGSATTLDMVMAGRNFLYKGDMAQDGYVYVSMDNRGTPLPRGRNWRKSVYRKVGVLNARDQAMGAKALMKKYSFIDPARTAVWGWSGGGSMTLNLMFQYPEIYKTGIAIAAVGNQLTYDNIYQERYMGLPEENREDFVKGSPITYAGNLQGNLLYIHGTGDDNVHYQNAEMLLNELIKYNKQFQFMAYPNRTHGISEGEGTYEHLSTLYTNYLQTHCAPGGR
ncbi:S9 family peptidase [Chitinophaga nivalis]|uniref:S9 family peptidase n=1 Tax=Chitinophaga nivalis TaxID=2991709 RepID=A0ABT3ILI3_9BACT|nr:S9 family peptidase [Chitinophaga nivalis]MCW3465495.1 S9 family peptidase [Chitinophaga nivalis]MCW3484814.1 S9 family peptidase [Chitinophaga nivalis]